MALEHPWAIPGGFLEVSEPGLKQPGAIWGAQSAQKALRSIFGCDFGGPGRPQRRFWLIFGTVFRKTSRRPLLFASASCHVVGLIYFSFRFSLYE